MKKLNLLSLTLGSVLIGASALAASPPKGGETCVACHGAKGISPNPLWPNLAGQKEEYLFKQLNDFREGRRNDPLMSPIAKGLRAEDLRTLAQYFSSLPGSETQK